ncbi:MAG: hypothetical protein IPJ26_17390 [Bacteroidetes bacterium]|nr:hypothetical protein [Bacteroidota bacterium]
MSSCTYSVQNSVGAEIYEWSAPVNSIISANGISVTAPATLITSSTSVDIIFPTSFINNGSVSVSAGYLNCAYRSPVWDVPGVAVTITGQGTSNPSITFPSNFGTAHVQVSAHDCPAVNFANLTGCHSSGSVIECLQVKSAPTIQGNISGPTNPCVSQTSVNYSIVSQCNTVATYDWIVIPSSMGTVVSGQGTENCNGTLVKLAIASESKATNSWKYKQKTYSVTVGNCRISDSNENKSLSNIQIYPNPNDGTFNVTNCDANCQLEIYNSLGFRVGYTLVKSSETVKT